MIRSNSLAHADRRRAIAPRSPEPPQHAVERADDVFSCAACAFTTTDVSAAISHSVRTQYQVAP